jgi:hypothetical protein
MPVTARNPFPGKATAGISFAPTSQGGHDGSQRRCLMETFQRGLGKLPRTALGHDDKIMGRRRRIHQVCGSSRDIRLPTHDSSRAEPIEKSTKLVMFRVTRPQDTAGGSAHWDLLSERWAPSPTIPIHNAGRCRAFRTCRPRGEGHLAFPERRESGSAEPASAGARRR